MNTKEQINTNLTSQIEGDLDYASGDAEMQDEAAASALREDSWDLAEPKLVAEETTTRNN